MIWITSPLKKLLLTVFALLLGCVVVILAAEDVWFELANKAVPAILCMACLYTAYSVLKAERLSIWAPLPWFLTACGVYYGFGPLIYAFGNPESVQYANDTYPVDAAALTRTVVLNCAAICTVLAGFIAGTKLPPFPPRLYSSNFNESFVRRLLAVFLCIGVSVKYLLLLPAHFGIINFVVPGSLVVLATLPSLAIILLFALMHETGMRKYKLMLIVLVASELLVSMMMLAKIAVITTALMVLLGHYLYRSNLKHVIIGAAIIAVTFIVFLTPFVNYARVAFNAQGIASVSEFGSSLNLYNEKKENRLFYLMPGVQAWWLRLNYANIQAYTMDAYDNGTPGTSLNLILVALIPRVIFPDKPNLQLGSEFNKLLTGEENSQSSPGYFAEAYWNGGWIYVIMCALALGLVFAIYTKFSIALIRAKKLGYLPVIFSGILLGLRPDDWYVPAVFVLSFQAAILYLILRKVYRLFGDA